ncbi:lytic polysaccharide monooxygenase [Brevibacillus sp. HD1.4A]|uniref:lytic polysaccharide monooxygenase n=1 Tax=Brevibacillus sp. HD1.4A TaxID=2738978 RepID=UPI00156ADC0C|nr:lytic polysaccharide monooxygenase [Brevibacillus sp. HD1.4A]NRQ55265.1 lytic polysaccharide monooxygenase [Brevibacillus sp. HD1.4A]
MDNVGLRNNLCRKGLALLFMLAMMLVAGAATLVFAEKASAHGYIESPASRSYLCKTGQNKGCGQIQYEPQSVEGIGSFPQSGPADGEFTGAGRYPELYAQTADRWSKVTLQGGQNTFTWKLTAPHSTAEWKYYITKKDWNPDKPLARADLELFCSFQDGGKRPPFTVTHSCNVPTDRSGYHIILGVWEIADTGMAFYQAIDVNLINDGTGGEQQPTVPGNVTSVSQTATSIELSWSNSVASNGIKQYDVYRDGQKIASTKETAYTDKGLTPATAYTYTVVAVDTRGKESKPSKALTVRTKAEDIVDTEAPTAPTGIMSHHQTETVIDLMWSPSRDNVGVVKYKVYRDGTQVGTVDQPSFVDKQLTPGTSYTYTIKAVDAAGNVSEASAPFAVSTKKKSPEVPGEIPAWDSSAVYVQGDRVIYNGLEYVAKWWVTGERPDRSDAWKLVSDAVLSWDAGKAYEGGTKVSYEDQIYKAKWWTKGEEPGKSAVWDLAE